MPSVDLDRSYDTYCNELTLYHKVCCRFSYQLLNFSVSNDNALPLHDRFASLRLCLTMVAISGWSEAPHIVI